jgi:hypothetical protein
MLCSQPDLLHPKIEVLTDNASVVDASALIDLVNGEALLTMGYFKGRYMHTPKRMLVP